MDEIIVLLKIERYEQGGELVHAFTDDSDVSDWIKKNLPHYKFRGDGTWTDTDTLRHWIVVRRCPISGIAQPL